MGRSRSRDGRLINEDLAAKLDQYVRRDDLADLKSQIAMMFRKLDDIRDGLAVDKGQAKYGWYFITSDRVAFSFRWCKKMASKALSFEAGWLLYIYMKDRDAWHKHQKAVFQFQPQIRTVK